MSFDPTKPVRTRDGRPARILATDLSNDTYPIAAALFGDSGEETVESFTRDGSYWWASNSSGHDLVNVPDRHELFAPIYGRSQEGHPVYFGEPVPSRFEAAARAANQGLGIARGLIKVTFEDGRPVSAEIVD